MPAWKAIRPYYNSDSAAQVAIGGNLPKGTSLYGTQPSAGDFRNFWINKFEGGMSGAPTQIASTASAATGAPAVAPATAAAPAMGTPTPGVASLAGGPGILGGLGIPPVQSVAPQPGARLAGYADASGASAATCLAAFATPTMPQLTTIGGGATPA